LTDTLETLKNINLDVSTAAYGSKETIEGLLKAIKNSKLDVNALNKTPRFYWNSRKSLPNTRARRTQKNLSILIA